MRPELVRFSSHPSSFWVRPEFCVNPECECSEVRFAFGEADEEKGLDGLKFQVRLDGETWRELDPPARPAAVAALVQEFLEDYPPQEKQALRTHCLLKKQSARRMRDFRFDARTIAAGKLVAFGEIVSDRRAPGAALSSYAYDFKYNGVEYLVDDLYCPNPDCDCREFHLAFIRCTPATKTRGALADDIFMATVPLAGGGAEIKECYECTDGEARAILSVWRERYRDDLHDHQWRYDKVKEIARRSLPRFEQPWLRSDSPLEPPLSDAEVIRAGRNDPCPCGSGKKFKKCCGQKKAGAIDLDASELE